MSREREAIRAMRAANFNPAGRTTHQIVSQCDAGLISIAEARCALNLVLKQARHAADYGGDSIQGCKRHNRVAAEARRALVAL